MKILCVLAAGGLLYVTYFILSLISAWLVIREVNQIQEGERK